MQATVTPAQPVIPKNIASGVQIVVTQNGQQLSADQVAQYLGGPFQLVGEYSGPGLTQTVEVPQSTPAPNSLVIDLPAVNTAGNYTLSNVRFVVNGASVFDVNPSSIPVQVIDQVLVTSVKTQPLTLDQIKAAGVVLDSSAYTGFQFTVGLQLSSQVVNVSFPVVFDPKGVAIPPVLTPPGISLPSGVTVPAPTIVPVLLQATDANGNPTSLPQLPGLGGGPVKIPSVIVIPGNVGYLKQFFSAQLYVSNGAPGGSNLTVENVTGTIQLPSAPSGNAADNPLALPNLTSGPQPPTMNVLVPGPDGTPSVASFNPGDTGQAQWTIRGDKEGYYTINFNIGATLQGLPTGPVNLTGSATGGVLVRNPYFNMTFTVPAVVRKGELFNVYATVTNISQVAANNLTVNFDQGALSGVTPVSPQSPVIPTLNAGDSTTLTFQFQSLQTGRVVASYLNFDTNTGTTGNLNFTLGVYANGTPMSPDTIVLPSAVDNLPTDVVDAAMRVIGQGWSVATAPTLPAGVIRTSRNVVTQKALLLAEAGLRQSLGEPLPNAVRDLALDLFSGSPVDPGFDQILRTTPAGQNFVAVIGANLAQPASDAGGALAYELQLAQLEASGPNFMTFAVASGSGPAPVSVSLTDSAGNQVTSSTPGGSILSGAIFPLGNSNAVPYVGVVTSPANSPYTLLLTGQASGTADISISIPAGDGTVIRGEADGVAVVQGQQMRVVADFNNPNNLVLQIDSAGDGSFATSVPMSTQVISPAGPTLTSATVIGSETISQASDFGVSAVLLFDRIVDPKTAGTVSNYTIPNNSVTSASTQLSGRLVFANLSQPEGPYVPTTFAVSGIQDQRNITGPSASVTLQSRIKDPGAVVAGRVLGADGSPSTTAVVTYVNTVSDASCQYPNTVGVASVPVQANGSYQFRYVHQDRCGGGFRVSTNDPLTGALRAVSSYVRVPGQQMVIDLAMLGLGSVTGTVSDLSGKPVYNAQVVAISGTDPQVGGNAYTDANGNYTITGITVGPVTVKAVQGISLGNSAGNIERAGTTATVNVTLNSGAVNVTGMVTVSQAGTVSPVPGAPVAYYLTNLGPVPIAMGATTAGPDGSYSIPNVPPGVYTVTAYLNSQLSASQSGVSAAGNNLVVPLQIAVPTTGTVNGKVTLPNGSPAAGVVVYQGQSGVLTNPDGTFSLPGIAVQPSETQTIYARSTDGLRSGQTNVIVGSATTPTTGASITLSGLGSAQFTVLDAGGKPMPNQQVVLPDGSPNCGGAAQTTNASGVATFTGLGLGSVHAVSVASGGNDLASGTAKITQDGTTGFAILQFHGTGTVTGSVVDPNSRPVFGAIIQLTSNAVDPNYCTLAQTVTQSLQTDPTGTFHFNNVTVGKVGVTAQQSFFPTQVGAQGVLASNGATVNFPLQMVNTISGVLSGTVFLPDGVTPAGAGVQVTANGPLPNVAVTTDTSGSFHFAKIFPQGFYTVTVNDPVSGGTNQTQIYLRAGQDMTQNMRLKGTGTVNVTVVDGAGIPVSTAFVTLTETDYPNASFSGSLDPSNLGVLPFANVFEGNFSVQVTDPFGRGGRVSGTLPQGTASVAEQVQLTTTGSVQGHFFMPDGVTPIANATIQLTANGQSIGQNTSLGAGDIGAFSFDYVPAGPVQVKGQDPLTGRTGIAAGTITSQGQTLALDIRAQGLDVIQGVVTSNGAPQAGASVNISSGTFQAATMTDATGMYVMNGVPEGVIVATASLGGGFLSGTAQSNISGDGNTLTLNVALRNSGTVTGQVLMADGVTPAPTSSVSIYVGGVGGGSESATTDTQGNFTLVNVPSGSGTISVQVLGGIDRATAAVDVAAGTTTPVQIKLNGTGGISGVALDSTGNPTAGSVALIGTGTFPYYLNLTAAADGTFAVPQVLAGPFTARLSANIGGFTLYGNTTGNVQPGQTTQFTVQVQPSGTITGNVLRPDGITPAAGAVVSVQLAGGGSITLQVQNDGTFTAVGVPLGSFSVQVSDQFSGGLAAFDGLSIGSNGQVVSLGTVNLDGNALSIVSSNPVDGSSGVAVNQALTVTFSEALSNTNGIFVSSALGTVSLSKSLSADGKTVTLQGQMPDGTPLVLNVTAQVTDVFGRQLLQAQTIHFTTVDLTPPYVTAVSPANQTIQVPVTSSISVSFDKALSTTASLANVIAVSSASGAITGTVSITSPNVLTFTPSAAMAENTIYTVTVNGAVSFGGNVQSSAFASVFVSTETLPPVLQLTAPTNGGYVGNSTPTISIAMSDSLTGIRAGTAMLLIDGQAAVGTIAGNVLSFKPATAFADGTHTIAASVQNNAGIIGSLSASFIIDTAPPSVAVLSGINAGQTLKGQISLSASATDAVSGVGSINFLVDGVVKAVLTGPSFAATFNTASIPDGPHNFSVQAISNAGDVGPASAAILAYVENVALSVTINSPASGAPFRNQVVVTATPSEPVQQVTFTLGTQTVSATSSPYQGTLSLSGVADGPQTITVTATDVVGDKASSSVVINVMQIPPAAPNANVIFAEPPNNGVSLVHGASGAVSGGGLTITIVDMATLATATATSGNDGSFATDISASVNDTLSVTATDVVGNVSAATLISVRSTPSLPLSSGATTLMYQGDLVDKVGGGTIGLAPDGQLDAVFTLSLNIGQGVTRTISNISLVGPQTRSTSNTGAGALGVAADVGSPLLNSSTTGQINFTITSGATLTLFAIDNGLIQAGDTYTVTAVFTDGSQFIATYTVVPPADRQYVAHSATITASPGGVIVSGNTPGTTTLTIGNIRDIDGNQVPDGAWIALSATDMASLDPRGNPIRSAGGVITDGTVSANNASFKVYQILNGSVTATYSSGTVSPSPISGAVAVIQMQAADANGNVLGTKASATADLGVHAATDQAVVLVSPGSLYADGNDRRANFTILVTDGAGHAAPDGTKVIVSVSYCASRFSNNACVNSAGGQIYGGVLNGSGQQVFTTAGGMVSGLVSDAGLTAGTGQINPNVPISIQVVPANSSGNQISSTVMGIGTLTLVGAGSSEVDVAPQSVAYVFPNSPLVQVVVHHLHDMRANLVPDGSKVILTASYCGARFDNNACVGSAGGTMGGTSTINSSGLGVYTLTNNETSGTYSAQTASAPGAEQVQVANVQILPANNAGNQIGNTEIAVAPINVLGLDNAIGTAQPASILADGAIHTTDVTFGPILDTYGNPIPDGSLVVAAAAYCTARYNNNACVYSAGGQIVNGAPSPSGSAYKVFTIQNGSISVTYADQNVTSGPGQIQTGNVVLLEANSAGAVQSITELGVVPVSLSGLTTAQGTASPTAVHADGGDYRSTITLSGFKDASGNAVPDGTQVALSAAYCASRYTNNACVYSAGGAIYGGTPMPGNSAYQLFTVTNGQVVAQYSSIGVAVGGGEQTATVQVLTVNPQGGIISSVVVATVGVQLLAPATSTVTVNPVDIFSDGASHLTQVTITGLLDADGVTPVPDGAKVALSSAYCAARYSNNACVYSVGGQIASGGASPGDGTPLSSNGAFSVFTVTGGKVVAAYADQGIASQTNQTQQATVQVVPLNSAGTSILSNTQIGVGTVNLHGATSATATGPTTLSISAQGSGTVTFSGIKDSAGNTVPDGTTILAATAYCATRFSNNVCVYSTGGTIIGGTTSPSNSNFQEFTVTNGSITLTYSTAGASVGTASVQLLPSQPNGNAIGNTVLNGGVWSISVTN